MDRAAATATAAMVAVIWEVGTAVPSAGVKPEEGAAAELLVAAKVEREADCKAPEAAARGVEKGAAVTAAVLGAVARVGSTAEDWLVAVAAVGRRAGLREELTEAEGPEVAVEVVAATPGAETVGMVALASPDGCISPPVWRQTRRSM